MINYDAARGVTVVTEPGPKTQSTLAIRAAGPQHSGNYTCCAANTEPAHIFVYVSEGSQYPSSSPSSSAYRRPLLDNGLPQGWPSLPASPGHWSTLWEFQYPIPVYFLFTSTAFVSVLCTNFFHKEIDHRL